MTDLTACHELESMATVTVRWMSTRYRGCMDEREDLEDTPELHAHAHAMQGIPDDARALGLDRNTTEGALVGMAGSLSGAKLSHRLVAWALLLVFLGPLLLGIVRTIF